MPVMLWPMKRESPGVPRVMIGTVHYHARSRPTPWLIRGVDVVTEEQADQEFAERSALNSTERKN